MKKILLTFAIISIFLVSPALALQYSYSYTGDKISGSGLSHQNYYAWERKDLNLVDQVVTSATISIKGLKNWDNRENHLYVSLLANMKNSTTGFRVAGSDNSNDNYFSNAFGSASVANQYGGAMLITDFALAYGGSSSQNRDARVARDVSFTITNQSLLDFFTLAIDDGKFALGFDADCHYWGREIKLSIETQPAVPEPSTVILLGVGVAGLGFLRFRRARQ